MRNAQPGEVDCGDCVGNRRCWRDEVAAGSGFMVRRIPPLAAGAILLRAGEPFVGPYLVTSGCLAVIELLEDGSERIVAFRVPGELVGLESWNLSEYRYGAQAISSSTVCRLRWNTPGQALRNATLLRTLLSQATAQCSSACLPWPRLAAADRLRAFVEDFGARTDQPLPMTREQIGSYLGMAEETVVRAFKSLESRGISKAAAPQPRDRRRRPRPG